MPSTTTPAAPFLERREATPAGTSAGRERRQFANSHDHLSPEADRDRPIQTATPPSVHQF